ncbi:unnamed protein product [Chrysoparadoxa australica]
MEDDVQGPEEASFPLPLPLPVPPNHEAAVIAAALAKQELKLSIGEVEALYAYHKDKEKQQGPEPSPKECTIYDRGVIAGAINCLLYLQSEDLDLSSSHLTCKRGLQRGYSSRSGSGRNMSAGESDLSGVKGTALTDLSGSAMEKKSILKWMQKQVKKRREKRKKRRESMNSGHSVSANASRRPSLEKPQEGPHNPMATPPLTRERSESRTSTGKEEKMTEKSTLGTQVLLDITVDDGDGSAPGDDGSTVTDLMQAAGEKSAPGTPQTLGTLGSMESPETVGSSRAEPDSHATACDVSDAVASTATFGDASTTVPSSPSRPLSAGILGTPQGGFKAREDVLRAWQEAMSPQPSPPRPQSARGLVKCSSCGCTCEGNPRRSTNSGSPSSDRGPAMVQPGDWKRGHNIGEGSFGSVYIGLNEVSGDLIAIKAMALNTPKMTAAMVDALYREIQLMRNLKHPHIVRYLGAELNEEDSQLCIFQEWVPGSVTSMLVHFGPFSESRVIHYTKQILSGLAYLHQMRIIHRDVKGSNILIDHRGTIKLCDFGASKRLELDNAPGLEGDHTCIGSPLFMAPELLLKQEYGPQVDIWSLGGAVLEMATGQPPWATLQFRTPVALATWMRTSSGPPPLPTELSQPMCAFLERCFERESCKRPPAIQLMNDPLFNKVRNNKQLLRQESSNNIEEMTPSDAISRIRRASLTEAAAGYGSPVAASPWVNSANSSTSSSGEMPTRTDSVRSFSAPTINPPAANKSGRASGILPPRSPRSPVKVRLPSPSNARTAEFSRPPPILTSGAGSKKRGIATPHAQESPSSVSRILSQSNSGMAGDGIAGSRTPRNTRSSRRDLLHSEDPVTPGGSRPSSPSNPFSGRKRTDRSESRPPTPRTPSARREAQNSSTGSGRRGSAQVPGQGPSQNPFSRDNSKSRRRRTTHTMLEPDRSSIDSVQSTPDMMDLRDQAIVVALPRRTCKSASPDHVAPRRRRRSVATIEVEAEDQAMAELNKRRSSEFSNGLATVFSLAQPETEAEAEVVPSQEQDEGEDKLPEKQPTRGRQLNRFADRFNSNNSSSERFKSN